VPHFIGFDRIPALAIRQHVRPPPPSAFWKKTDRTAHWNTILKEGLDLTSAAYGPMVVATITG